MRFIIYLILTILSCIFSKISYEKYEYKKFSLGNILCNIIPLVSIIYSVYFCIYIYTGKIGIIGIDAISILSLIVPAIIILSIVRLIGNFTTGFKYNWTEILYDISLQVILMVVLVFGIIISFNSGETGKVYEQKEETIEITLLDKDTSTYINGIISSKNFKNTVQFYYEDEKTKDKSDIKVIPSGNSYVEVFESDEETNPRIEVYSVSNIVRNVFEKEFTNKTYLKYEIYVPTGTVNYTFKNSN